MRAHAAGRYNDVLTWAAWSRFNAVRQILGGVTAPRSEPFTPAASAFRLLAAGDVHFDRQEYVNSHVSLGPTPIWKPPLPWTIGRRVSRRLREICYRRLISPRLLTQQVERDAFVEFSYAGVREGWQPYWHGANAQSRAPVLVDSTSPAVLAHPFERIAPMFHSSDLTVVNLETPLSARPRKRNWFRSDPAYATAIRDAGIDVVNVSNNHIFDMGEAGFFDTLEAVQTAGLAAVGVGRCFDDARRGRVVERNGLRFLFLSYSQLCNSHFASLATSQCPGILPLDRQLMREDVEAARGRADFVIVSVHWGFEDQPNVHPQQVEIAHLLIDAGADCILGHHSHCPHAIEIYRERPIFYSLGNLIFGIFWRDWADNMVVELVIEDRRIQGVIVHPVATATAEEQFQPAPSTGPRAEALLRSLQLKSVVFGTAIAIDGDKGYISTAPRAAAVERIA